jgi:hypothetical protein
MKTPPAVKTTGGLAALAAVGLLAACGTPTIASPATSAKSDAAAKAMAAKAAKKKAPPKGSLTFAQYKTVHTGMTKAQVRALVGAPKDKDYTESELLGETTKLETWTYTNRGEQFGAFVFSFTDGKLDSKGSV